MPTKKKTAESKWVDPDDAPKLTKEWFERADLYHGDKLIRRGRPKAEVTKKLVSLRLDRDVIDHFQRSGPGWQRRINDALRKVARLKTPA
jgi:uncharacterized protein (DUF4415 family)